MQRILVFPPMGWARTGAAEWPYGRLWPWALPALVLIGLGLRLALIARPGLHPDEALYASWALRIAAGSDPALLGVYVDKPPLWFYLLAGLFRLAGVTPGAAAPINFDKLILLGRLAGVAAAALSLILLYAIANRAYGRPAALLAAAFFALSPLAAGLSPTLFTDSLLVLCWLLGLWAALDRRAWLAGIACGLAYAAKQQAILLIPLVALLFLLAHGLRPSARSLWRLLNGFLLIFALVTWWDSLRWQWMPSFWDRSLTTYGGLAPAPLDDLDARLAAWGDLLLQGLGSPFLAILLAASLPVLVWRGLRRWRDQTASAGSRAGKLAGSFDLAVIAFSATYLLLHLLVNFAPWDRYALPLTPLLALLLARGLLLLPQSAAWRWLLSLILIFSLGQAAWSSRSGQIAAGDARGYDGAAPLASYLRSTQPAGAALYHHWLGWHYQLYLYDSPLEQRWWESPADLAAKAAAGAADFPLQLIAFPAGRDERPAREALAAAGLDLEPRWQYRRPDGSLSLSLYAIRPARSGVDHEFP